MPTTVPDQANDHMSPGCDVDAGKWKGLTENKNRCIFNTSPSKCFHFKYIIIGSSNSKYIQLEIILPLCMHTECRAVRHVVENVPV